MRSKIFLIILMSIILIACTDENDATNAGRYGMMSKDTPQYTAVLFMRAVYEEKDMQKIVALSEKRLANRLKSLHTAKNIQRHILGLRLDSMTAEPVSGGTLLYSELKDDATIEIKIIGQYNGDKVTELRILEMVKESGDWKVAEVKTGVY
ncbi:hypothetical protein [Glaciecola sp. 1036]|uniref:hypothetical protein n=1 Tax=Alteromonadaceae TaxID=72275 RepID=UPI003D0317BE